LSFSGVIFTGYGVEVKLIANSGFTAPNGPGNRPDTIPFVVQDLDLVPFIFGELGVVFFIASVYGNERCCGKVSGFITAFVQ
jgi:hypothetical protein